MFQTTLGIAHSKLRELAFRSTEKEANLSSYLGDRVVGRWCPPADVRTRRSGADVRTPHPHVCLFHHSRASWARHLKRERPRLLHETTQDRTPGGAALTGARPGRRPGGRNNKPQNPHSGTVEARRPVCHVRVLLL